MTKVFSCVARILSLLALAFLLPALQAQTVGPDVIVGDLPEFTNYGSVGNMAAFAVGTTSCNQGTQNLSWVAGTNQHPVIGYSMYRIKDGRFTQIGLSWLKHGFLALTQNLCSTCNGQGGSVLGVGCSDPYGSGLNGSQSPLGARSEVNAATGAFPFPRILTPAYPAIIGRRLQVHHADLDPTLNAGAVYVVEGQYVTPDDAAAGNAFNNASYREVRIAPSGSSFNIAGFLGATQRTKPAILAWQDKDPAVQVATLDIPNDGRILVGLRAIDLLNGMYRFEYAIHNLNSDRSVQALNVTMPAGATVQNMGFHDVDYHSGEIYSLADWTPAVTSNGVTWSTDAFTVNQNANALRWGTTYSFWFESDMIPTGESLDLFKPGIPASVGVTLNHAPCPLNPYLNPPTGSAASTYTLDTAAPYDFVNIAGSNQGPTTDDGNLTVPLGFSFPFFGAALTQIRINSNGMLYLVGENGTFYVNSIVPGGGLPNGQIAGYWDDLNPAVAGTILYNTVGTAPNRRFVVSWDGVPHFGNASQLETFEIILDENGKITTSWVSSADGGASASLGIEAANGFDGVLGAFNQAGVVQPLTSWTYTPQGGSVPLTAHLQIAGDGSANTWLRLDILSIASAPFILAADTDPGPVSVPGFGTIPLGFSPAFTPILDGTGIFTGIPNPLAVTDGCGHHNLSIFLNAPGLPSGLSLSFFAAVLDSNAPNGVAHLTNGALLNVP